jgi:hypothetical protein
MVSAGWHMHLDVLAARPQRPADFWEGWSRLQTEYDQRLPA